MTKKPVTLRNIRVLGLSVKDSGDGKFVSSRDGELPVLSENVTKRELFSVCGKLVGHYPVVGWLRTAAASAREQS